LDHLGSGLSDRGFLSRLRDAHFPYSKSLYLFSFIIQHGKASDADISRFFHHLKNGAFRGDSLLEQLPPERIENIKRLMAAGD
jgi:hypothetical protein